MESGNTFTRFLVDKYIDRNMLSFVFPSLQSGWMALFQSGRSLGGATTNNTGAAVDRSNSQSSTTYLLYLSIYLPILCALSGAPQMQRLQRWW